MASGAVDEGAVDPSQAMDRVQQRRTSIAFGHPSEVPTDTSGGRFAVRRRRGLLLAAAALVCGCRPPAERDPAPVRTISGPIRPVQTTQPSAVPEPPPPAPEPLGSTCSELDERGRRAVEMLYDPLRAGERVLGLVAGHCRAGERLEALVAITPAAYRVEVVALAPVESLVVRLEAHPEAVPGEPLLWESTFVEGQGNDDAHPRPQARDLVLDSLPRRAVVRFVLDDERGYGTVAARLLARP